MIHQILNFTNISSVKHSFSCTCVLIIHSYLLKNIILNKKRRTHISVSPPPIRSNPYAFDDDLPSAEQFYNLSKEDRDAVVKFIDSI